MQQKHKQRTWQVALKNATVLDASDFAKMTDLANLKSNVDKLDIDKLETIPVDLSKLSISKKWSFYKD